MSLRLERDFDGLPALQRLQLTDHAFAAALEAETTLIAGEAARPCANRCGAQVKPCLQADHDELCEAALVECPLGCGAAAITRAALWQRHLARECDRFVVYCSSFCCERTDSAPPRRLDPHSAPAHSCFVGPDPNTQAARECSQRGASESAAAAASSSSSASAVSAATAGTTGNGPAIAAFLSHRGPFPADLCFEAVHKRCRFEYELWSLNSSGCNLLRAVDPRTGQDAASHVHAHADRLAWEQIRFFALPESSAEAAEQNALHTARRKHAGAAPALAHLLVCPCCQQRLVVSTLPDGEAHDGGLAPIPTAAILTRAQAREHFEQCELRRDAHVAATAAAAVSKPKEVHAAVDQLSDASVAVDGAPNAAAAVVCLPPAAASDFLARAADTGIFKFLPRTPDVDLGSIPAAEAARDGTNHGAAAASAGESAAAASSASSSSSAAPSVPLVLSFSHALQQYLLLHAAVLLSDDEATIMRRNALSPVDPRRRAIAEHAVEQLLRQGASIAELVSMYAPTPPPSPPPTGAKRMHKSMSVFAASKALHLRPGVRPLGRNDGFHLPIETVAERLYRAQRPLLAPLLEPFFIPDLANIVLSYC